MNVITLFIKITLITISFEMYFILDWVPLCINYID